MADVRYIRWAQEGTSLSGLGSYSHFTSLQAFGSNGVNVAATSGTASIYQGTWESGAAPLSDLISGQTTTQVSVEGGTGGIAIVQIDLGSNVNLTSITSLCDIGGYVSYNVTVSTSPDGSSWTTVYGPANVPTLTTVVIAPLCFVRGARLATPHGPRAVEDLKKGDTVHTSDGVLEIEEAVAHAWPLDTRDPHLVPWRVPRGVAGAQEDLVLSARHGVWVDGALVPAAKVPGAVPATFPEGSIIRYHHLRLPLPHRRALLVAAGGVLCESLR
jgi:hypothetical protein